MKFLAMMMLLATFLGGYYLGHKPDSPDIFGWASGAYDQVARAAAVAQDFVGQDGPSENDKLSLEKLAGQIGQADADAKSDK